jgi:hypothetical protein
MPDKSYVTMSQKVCPICHKVFDDGTLVLDKMLREKFDSHTITGYGVCPEDQKMVDKGYVALVEIDPLKSGTEPTVETAWHTGAVVWVRRTAVKKIFSHMDVLVKGKSPMAYIDPEVTAKLKEMMS